MHPAALCRPRAEAWAGEGSDVKGYMGSGDRAHFDSVALSP